MVYVPKRRKAGPLAQGDRVRVVARAGGLLDDGSSTFELRGEQAQVVGANPTYVHPKTGERMTAVELGNGAIATVPSRALKREE